MPHFVVEYTDNLKNETDIRLLLKKANEILMAQDGAFPIGGVRSRAIELKDYVMSDDEEDYAFVHASLTIGAGRSKEVVKKVLRRGVENCEGLPHNKHLGILGVCREQVLLKQMEH